MWEYKILPEVKFNDEFFEKTWMSVRDILWDIAIFLYVKHDLSLPNYIFFKVGYQSSWKKSLMMIWNRFRQKCMILVTVYIQADLPCSEPEDIEKGH